MDFQGFDSSYFGQTVLHPLGLLAVVVLGLAMLALPRRYAAVPMLVMACFVAPAQRIAILSLNFDLLRLMVAFGIVRVLLREEWRPIRWRPIDTAFVCWSVLSAIVYILLWSSTEAVKLKAGHLYNQLGIYFLFRCLVRQWDDLWLIAKAFVAISVPVMVAFVAEHATGRNAFAFLGGVPEITVIREDRLRCQGAFAHPILAGCFWAAQLPLIAALWWKGARVAAATGVVCSMVIIAMCASSTPVMGVICAIVGAAMFASRDWMRLVRWSVLLLLLCLHMMMDAPVWHLMARIDLAGGSTGWHRANLVSQAVNRLGDWWMLGTRTTADWNVFKGDITNQYVLEGIRGGLLSMILFIAVISLAFGCVGRLWRNWSWNPPNMVMAWALGVSVFVHVMCFLGVSYFGQISTVWFMLLAIVASLSESPAARKRIVRRPRSLPGVPALSRTQMRSATAGCAR